MTQNTEQRVVGKKSKKDMIEEIKEDLIVYFRQGYINPKRFFEFDDFRFNDIHDILKIHFILTEEVQEYVLGSEKSIRNIKNSTKLEKNTFRGEIRGSIDWDKTIEYRMNTVYSDKSNFVCNNVDKLYSTKENIVLKSAVSIIYNIIHRQPGMDRFTDQLWYKNGELLSKIIFNIYKSNVYIKKIDISKVKLSDKMIFDVSKSRNKIYRDSAQIVKLYKDIMDLKKEHIRRLFEKTFIDMKDENEVFELYSIFKYLRTRFPLDIKFNIIDGKEDCLANLEDKDYRYKIYHNETASEYLKFAIDISEVKNSKNIFVKKKIRSLKRKAEIYSEMEEKGISSSFWEGRPDLLLLRINKENDLIDYIEIGEAKYTNNKSYMYKGLEELLEYIYFIKDKEGKYIDDIEVKGILFVDNIRLPKYDFKDIEIINSSLI